ncbi:IS110 family transposase [Mycolicibacterium sp.]|uniref:IS110 family transposase n=1 Tax=Mycolicibacterium sp. TaxID=2320850 RepID=UPI003D0975B4
MTPRRRVVIGIDTHLDTIHLAAITDTGQLLGDAEFATSPAGYWAAICWARSFGEVLSVGVEGTGSYGAGITQALQANDIHVAEVNRPDRAARRKQGNPIHSMPTAPPVQCWPVTAWPCPKTPIPGPSKRYWSPAVARSRPAPQRSIRSKTCS